MTSANSNRCVTLSPESATPPMTVNVIRKRISAYSTAVAPRSDAATLIRATSRRVNCVMVHS
jgi:hypothetical protein